MECKRNLTLANGRLIYTRIDNELHDALAVSHRCDPGYELNGTYIRKCGNDGQWKGTEKTCIRNA